MSSFMSKPTSPPPSTQARRFPIAGSLWFVTWALVGVWFLAKSNLNVEIPRPSSAAASSRAPANTPKLETQPIETLCVGQRLPARNPDVTDAQRRSFKTAINPSTWKRLKLRAEVHYPNGILDDHNIVTLQPPEWIAKHKAKVGAMVPIPLDLVEMGSPSDLKAKVLAIERCPQIEDGPGQVIQTTVNHLNQFLFRLTITDDRGQSETIGVTGHHKMYSRSRKAWVSAKDLQEGEELGYLSRPVTVTSLERSSGTHRVYNLTIENEHAYQISPVGVLVHNENCKLRLTDEARRKLDLARSTSNAQKYRPRQLRQAIDHHYEDLVRRKTGGSSKVIDGYEIDAVTDKALIQAKRVYNATDNPKKFIKQNGSQIKKTIELARKEGKEAQFWFKYGVDDIVRKYIVGKGGKVIIGLGG